jgi:carboxyl-terminal processing protease
MRRSTGTILLWLVITAGLVASATGAGFVAGRTSRAWLPNLPGLTASASLGQSSADQAGTPKALSAVFAPFWEAWDIANEQFVDQPLDQAKLVGGAIRGMINAIGDKHSSYMDPDEYRRANAPLEGGYEGIGAEVDITGDYVEVISTFPESPAEKAGLRTGDAFIRVDSEDMTGIDGNEVVRKILGPVGSPVHLSVQREGEAQLLEFELVRARIAIPSMEAHMLKEGIAYVRLYAFADETGSDLRQALQNLLANDPTGLILDLRGNPGGSLQASVEVASQFLSQGQTVLIEQYGDGSRQTISSLRGGLATDIPLIVLVDRGSASASEVVAGAIQDLHRAQLVGEVTYGKGSVQNWIPLKNDQGAVRITIARWLTPDGRQIAEVGLTPDVVVPLTEEDHSAGRDPQLEKAIELLTAQPS